MKVCTRNELLTLLFMITNPQTEGVELNGSVVSINYCGSAGDIELLMGMRANISYYTTIIDTYAPCIVGKKEWNNDAKMRDYCCGVHNRKTWSLKILSVSDEAFLLLVLLNYGKKWFDEEHNDGVIKC